MRRHLKGVIVNFHEPSFEAPVRTASNHHPFLNTPGSVIIILRHATAGVCQCWLSIGGHSHGDSVWGGNRRRSWKSSRSAVWWSNGSEIAIFYSFVVGRNKANVWDQSEFILVFVLSVANTAEPDWAMLVNVSYPDLIHCREDNLWDLFSISCHSWQFLVQVG